MEIEKLEQKQLVLEDQINKLSAQEEDKKESKAETEKEEAIKRAVKSAFDKLDDEQRATYIEELHGLNDEQIEKALASIEPNQKDKEIAKLQARIKSPLIESIISAQLNSGVDQVSLETLKTKLSAKSLDVVESVYDIVKSNIKIESKQSATAVIPAQTTNSSSNDIDAIFKEADL